MRKTMLKVVAQKRPFWLTLFFCICSAPLLLNYGCQLILGLPAIFGTPTSSETKIPAEYDLTQNQGQKIMVLVEQPFYLNTSANMRFFMTDAMIKMLKKYTEIPAESFIDYDAVADLRSKTPNFSLLPPEKAGSLLGADFVLLVVVSNFQVSPIGDSGYYNGLLDAQAMLIDVASGQKVWPALEQSKIVKVGFESQRTGSDAAAVRLSVAAAHCITRYLYDCRKNKFKISEERTDIGWENQE